MKPSTIKIGIILVAILFAFCTDSWAHSPKARELCGVIQEINAKKHTLIVRSPERKTPVTLTWTRDTEFVQNQQTTKSTMLKTGLSVCVYYHSPFFGKPFATKMVWQTP
jgi:hypothetical protein